MQLVGGKKEAGPPRCRGARVCVCVSLNCIWWIYGMASVIKHLIKYFVMRRIVGHAIGFHTIC